VFLLVCLFLEDIKLVEQTLARLLLLLLMILIFLVLFSLHLVVLLLFLPFSLKICVLGAQLLALQLELNLF